MTFIRVNPVSLLGYADQANQIFRSVRTTLDTLVDEAVMVDYEGENAVEFKRQCGQMAVDFANALNGDVRQIASAVSASTSAISGSLGGQPITLDINVEAFALPAVPASDGSVQVQTEGLEALRDSVTAHMAAIKANFGDHMATLMATDWEGSAKESAVSAIGSYTGDAEDAVDTTSTRITGFIADQVSASLTADV